MFLPMPFLVYLALSLLTAGKQLLAVGSLLPMNIYLAGSYNQDCVSIGLIILTISLFVQMATTEKIPLSKLFGIPCCAQSLPLLSCLIFY